MTALAWAVEEWTPGPAATAWRPITPTTGDRDTAIAEMTAHAVSHPELYGPHGHLRLRVRAVDAQPVPQARTVPPVAVWPGDQILIGDLADGRWMLVSEAYDCAEHERCTLLHYAAAYHHHRAWEHLVIRPTGRADR